MISCYVSSSYDTDIFNTNTCASFKNRLPKLEDVFLSMDPRKNTHQSYSKTITDLYYPSMIFNVSSKDNDISFVHLDKDDILNMTIQPKFYPIVNSVVEAINASL